MKRFWRNWLTGVASALMVSTAGAQPMWNQTNDLGSYQSIMSRAGIPQEQYHPGVQPHPGYPNGYAPQAAYGAVNGQALPPNGFPQGGVQVHGQPAAPMYGNIASGHPGQPVNGTAVNQGNVVANGPVPVAPVYGNQGASCGVDGGYGQGYGNGQAYGVPGYAAPGYTAPSCGVSGYGAPGYAAPGNAGASLGQGSYFDGNSCGANVGTFDNISSTRSMNWVLGTRALFFTRNGEAPIALGRNNFDTLWSTENDYGTMPGAEVSLIGRNCNGRGIEARYWGLFPSGRTVGMFDGMPETYLTGFQYFLLPPDPDNLLDFFNNADEYEIYRNNEVYNVELNALKNAGSFTSRGGRAASYEWIAGFRWFQFNEDYRFSALDFSPMPNERVDYELGTRNTLLGFQLGGRSEVCVTDRLSFIGGTKIGLFNNRSCAYQRIMNENGEFAYHNGSGVDYDYWAQRDNLAMIGELDLGIAYRFSQRVRANVGYRLIGINGIALAPNQIPRNFENENEIYRINSNDSLILSGGYAGLEMCF